MDEIQSLSLWLKCHPVYCSIGFLASLLYGVYAVTLWFRPPEMRVAVKGINCKAWREAWKDLVRHPRYLHECWFNFFGSAIGWLSLAYLMCRLQRFPFGIVEAGLALTAALGMVGYLPNTIAGIASSFHALANRLSK